MKFAVQSLTLITFVRLPAYSTHQHNTSQTPHRPTPFNEDSKLEHKVIYVIYVISALLVLLKRLAFSHFM